MNATHARRFVSKATLLVVACGLVAASPSKALAATLNVTKLEDTSDGACNSDCSLREAIDQANLDATQDTIVLPTGTLRVDLAGAGPEDANASGDLDVNKDLIIRGAGAQATTVQAFLPPPPSLATDRVLDAHGSLTDLELSDLTVAGGQAKVNGNNGEGGGVRSNDAGDLTLERVVMRDNAALGGGTAGYGGAISKADGRLFVRDSAITGNTAVAGYGFGGGIFLSVASAELTNVTLTGNRANMGGGGIFFNSANNNVSLTHTTVSGNDATQTGGGLGGGAFNGTRLRSSIIAGNTAPTGANCDGGPASDGGNVGDPACGLTQPSDAQTLDPQLAPLGNTPIPVLEPLAGSPAIDRAVGACPPTDARGVKRPQGPACDAGAAELPVAVPPAAATGTLQTLALDPTKFRASSAGGPVATAAKRARIGTGVSYTLSESATVGFKVERRARGRKVGSKCRAQTRKNRKRRRCTLYASVKGSDFTRAGAKGTNAFRFTGRTAKRRLRPGRYRLVATAGVSVKLASFQIVR